MLHPGRTGRNHLRALATAAGDRRRARRRAAGAGRAHGRRATGAPAATRSACASGSGWRPRCSATRGCWCSTSPRTGSTRRASAGCATSCARLAARGPRDPRLQPRAGRGRADRRRRRRHQQGPLGRAGAAGGDHGPQQPAAGCRSRARTSAGSATSLRAGRRRSAATDSEILVTRHERRGHRAPDRRAPARRLRALAGRRLARGHLLRTHRRRREARHDPARRRRAVQDAHDAHVLRARRQRARPGPAADDPGLRVRGLRRHDDGPLDVLLASSAASCRSSRCCSASSPSRREFRHGTITPSLLVVPNRVRLMLAKLVAALLDRAGARAVSTGLIIVIVAAVRLGPRLRHRRATSSQLFVGGALDRALYAALGVGLGALVRNQVGAIVGALVYVFVLEPALGRRAEPGRRARRDHAQVQPRRGRQRADAAPTSRIDGCSARSRRA